MEIIGILILIVISICLNNLKHKRRRDYYRNNYLKSEAWQRKRYLVLKRDNCRCVYCGARATQVHHLRYAKNIGREPIEWLVSICDECHKARHQLPFFNRTTNSLNSSGFSTWQLQVTPSHVLYVAPLERFCYGGAGTAPFDNF